MSTETPVSRATAQEVCKACRIEELACEQTGVPARSTVPRGGGIDYGWRMIDFAYQPEKFAQDADAVIAAMKNYLIQCQASSPTRVAIETPAQLQALATQSLGQQQSVSAVTELFLRHSLRLQSPHYMGHQVPPPIPLSSLFGALSQLCNQGGAVQEMSPFVSQLEKAIVARLLDRVGWAPGPATGIVTNGGTLAQMTGLLAARNRHFNKSWQHGLADAQPIVFCSADAHYSVSRAAGVLGIGTSQVHAVAVNAERQLDSQRLRDVLNRWQRTNGTPFCIVGSACSTATGSFDNLRDLADIAREFGLWFQVDGAHGASFLFSQRYRHRLSGIELADSVVWDAHKMLFVPSLCTFLLYQRTEDSLLAFQQDAPYLFDANDPEALLRDGGLRTHECTRQALVAPLWGVWAVYGEALFEQLIDRVMQTTETFYELLSEAGDFVPLHQPTANILCFRYQPPGITDEAVSPLQVALRQQLLNSGKFYLTMTRLQGHSALRVTVINPLTTKQELIELMDEIRRVGHNVANL